MATIGCNEFLDQLEPWMEGERHPDAQAHVRNCPRCRNVAADLDLIHVAAHELALTDPEPPARVWNSLRAQLQQEGLIREGRSVQSHWWNGWFTAMPRPALAGAYLALLIAVGFAASGPINHRMNKARWLEGTQMSTTALGAQLNTAEQKTVFSSLPDSNPVVTASLHSNLAIVDKYISLCEKSVSEEPENEVARDYLFDAYQQKADLLAQINERGGTIQ
jgi:hypothetical protein